jgi:hypothetical protein
MKQTTTGSYGRLRAGSAHVEITPKAGVHLSGAVGQFRPAQSVADPLYAKAVVLEAGGRRICIVALDVTIITAPWTEKIRAGAKKFGLDHDAVMVHAIQTHSAPSVGHFMLDEDFPDVGPEFEWLRGGETSFYEFASDRAVEAIRLASEAMQPVSVAVGSAVKDGLAFNRRGVTRDGSVVMPWLYSSTQQPLGPTNIRYLEGPTDPEVGVMCFRNDDAEIVAMLLHYTCHPVNVFSQAPNLVVSADWPGAWATSLRSEYGFDCMPVVLNGCCGNINPWPALEPDFVPDHRRMGRELAEMASRVINRLTFQDIGVADFKIRTLPLPLRQVAPQALQEAERVLADHPLPKRAGKKGMGVDWDWLKAALTMSVHLMRKRHPELPYEIQVLRVGDTALVGLPGEPFVEGQLRIKIGSPTYPTYVAHCTSQYVGYLPIKEAFARGGHEVDTSYWSKLTPDALDMVVESAVSLLKEVFPR